MKEYNELKPYVPEFKIPETKPFVYDPDEQYFTTIKVLKHPLPKPQEIEIKPYIPEFKIPRLEVLTRNYFEENFQEKRREDERREINRRLSTYHL